MKKTKKKTAKKKTTKRKGLFGKARVKGARVRKLKNQKRKKGEDDLVPAIDFQDKFADDNTSLDADDAYVSHPVQNDVQDELSYLDGFREFADEIRGNNLTYGDY